MTRPNLERIGGEAELRIGNSMLPRWPTDWDMAAVCAYAQRMERVVAAARAVYDNRKLDDLEDEMHEIRLSLDALDGVR